MSNDHGAEPTFARIILEVEISENLPREPGHISRNYGGAHYALEVNAGQARLFGIRPGDMLAIEH